MSLEYVYAKQPIVYKVDVGPNDPWDIDNKREFIHSVYGTGIRIDSQTLADIETIYNTSTYSGSKKAWFVRQRLLDEGFNFKSIFTSITTNSTFFDANDSINYNTTGGMGGLTNGELARKLVEFFNKIDTVADPTLNPLNMYIPTNVFVNNSVDITRGLYTESALLIPGPVDQSDPDTPVPYYISRMYYNYYSSLVGSDFWFCGINQCAEESQYVTSYPDAFYSITNSYLENLVVEYTGWGINNIGAALTITIPVYDIDNGHYGYISFNTDVLLQYDSTSNEYSCDFADYETIIIDPFVTPSETKVVPKASVLVISDVTQLQGPNLLVPFFFNSTIFDPFLPDQPTDPYSPGGVSGAENGEGSFDYEGDTIEDSPLPTWGAAGSGFVQLYRPSQSQIQALATYMLGNQNIWSTLWDAIKRVLEDPMDALIALNVVPCSPSVGSDQSFKVLFIDTGVTMPVITNQFVDVNCGSLQLTEFTGSFLDYSPNTSVDLFLPFIGTVPLDTDEVMGRTISIIYRIDLITCTCVAKVSIDGNIMYQFTGGCGFNIPITAKSYTNYLQVATSLVAAAVSAGISASTMVGVAAMPEVVSSAAPIASPGDGSIIPYNAEGLASGSMETGYNLKATQYPGKQIDIRPMIHQKPTASHSGGFGGSGGFLGVRYPYLIIKAPRLCNPENYGELLGRPSEVYGELGSFSGYCEVRQVQLTGISATSGELTEIETLLKGGIIL